MKKKADEFERFDETMDRLLSVPYSELQKKLEDEKRAKEKKKQKQKKATSSSGRVSSRKT